MTPSYWSNGYIDDLPSVYEDPNACEFAIESNGQLYARTTSNRYSGIRPVINLKSDTEFQAGGNGTLENPYVVT